MTYNLERTGLRLYALRSKDINRVKMLPFKLISDLLVLWSRSVNCILLLEGGEGGTVIFLVVNPTARRQRHGGVRRGRGGIEERVKVLVGRT